MGKRAFEQVSTNLPVDYSWGSELHEGIAKNLSNNSMCIDAEVCPPFGANIEVVLILGDEVFKLPARVKRTLSTKKLSGMMFVELLDPPESYCRFVSVVQDYAYHGPYSKIDRRIRERVAS